MMMHHLHQLLWRIAFSVAPGKLNATSKRFQINKSHHDYLVSLLHSQYSALKFTNPDNFALGDPSIGNLVH